MVHCVFDIMNLSAPRLGADRFRARGAGARIGRRVECDFSHSVL
jgi:hypothetical protein